MPKHRPNLSITLPRNFTFHFTEGQEPKTPEDERPPPQPAPHSPQPYRIKRRARPPMSQIANLSFQRPSTMSPVDTVATSEQGSSAQRPISQQRPTEPVSSLLSPARIRPFRTAPRASSKSLRPSADFGGEPKTPTNLQIAESIERPMSACSLVSSFSSSSDGSDTSVESHLSLSGSCTSPESEADPFMNKTITKSRAQSIRVLFEQQELRSKKTKQVPWTREMDHHLWTTYLRYLQDPTVTPFKLLPGAPPPLGICHRVARDARKTWRSSRFPSKPRGGLRRSGSMLRSVSSADSPETIRPSRSGSNTPTGTDADTPSKRNVWPKSGSATRRRLRYLSKNEPTLAPHYQRMLNSRSPSPSSFSSPPSQSRQTRYLTPPSQRNDISFDTRDFRLSLIGSTAASMQPEGPLAQLAQRTPTNDDIEMDFNTPIVPFASEAPIPSDIDSAPAPEAAPEPTPCPTIQQSIEPISQQETSSPPRHLGSPVTFHTWGPSRSRKFHRPSTSRMHTDNDLSSSSTSGLKSPIKLHDNYDTFPYPNAMKRRAQHELEDEVSPGGSEIRKEIMEHLFGGQAESSNGRHRRVRSRGFSLGDASLRRIFTPPDEEPPLPRIATANVATATSSGSDQHILQAITDTGVPPRLGSPFPGVAPRPSHYRPASRHGASASMSAAFSGGDVFRSIDQTLGHHGEYHHPPPPHHQMFPSANLEMSIGTP